MLATPESWTRQVFARRANGEACYPNDSEAVAWCLTGALDEVFRHGSEYKEETYRAAVLCLYACLVGRGESHIYMLNTLSAWNEHPARTHAHICMLIADALARTKEPTRET